MKIRWLLLTLVLVILLVPAGMLTVGRLIEPTNGPWVRIVAFTPYALVGYALGFLLLVLAWVRGRGPWRMLARIGTVLALLGVVVHLLWLSPGYVGTPAIAANGASFRVMTLNLRVGQADPARVVEVAVRNQVDVLVLTEITPASLGRMQAAGLGEAFPYSIGHPTAGGEGTMVFAGHRLGKSEKLDTAYGSYVVPLRLGGQMLRLVAVHPHAPTGDAQQWVEDQAAVRRAAVAVDEPTMVVGDFNATMDHQPMRELVGRGFHDAATQATSQWQPTWPASGEVRVLGLAIPSLLALDHVLVSGPLHATWTETVQVPGTDHRALLAQVSW